MQRRPDARIYQCRALLQGVLMDSGIPAKKCGNPNACYLFRSPTRYARHLAEGRFDAISVNSNHARDFGEVARSSSMESLAVVGIHHSGRAGDFASFEAQGLKIAFLAFAVTRESNKERYSLENNCAHSSRETLSFSSNLSSSTSLLNLS